MATQQEIEEVQAFLKTHDGQWVSCQQCETEMPSLLHRKIDESDCLPYHVNSVCQEAGIPGRIEEHGSDDWLVSGEHIDQPLYNFEHFTAIKTNDHDMGTPTGEPALITPREAIDYLNANPRHALVISDFEEISGECEPEGQVAIFRGAGDGPDEFYYQLLPLEDPNDAEGGDLSATEAIAKACDALCE